MSVFTIGSFAAGQRSGLGGFSFTPNVPGPNSSGSPGSATQVTLQQVILGYPYTNPSYRAPRAYVYSAPIDPADFDFDDLPNQNRIGASTTYVDGTFFGANGYSRTFIFDVGVVLEPTKKYYIYFNQFQYVNVNDEDPYSGGNAYDDVGDSMPDDDCQFQISFSV